MTEHLFLAGAAILLLVGGPMIFLAARRRRYYRQFTGGRVSHRATVFNETPTVIIT